MIGIHHGVAMLDWLSCLVRHADQKEGATKEKDAKVAEEILESLDSGPAASVL